MHIHDINNTSFRPSMYSYHFDCLYNINIKILNEYNNSET